MPTPEIADIQGLLMRDYRLLDGAAYLLVRIDDGERARVWLKRLLPDITNAVSEPDSRAINLAFTFSGLRKLGLPDETTGIRSSFQEGMVGPRRSRILGDRGENDPERWNWGGPKNEEFDLILMLFAKDDSDARDFAKEKRREFEAAGMFQVLRLDTHLNRFGKGVKEHFGFHDGIGQPAIANDTDVNEGVLAPDRPSNTVATGEFVIGYKNEFGELPRTPIVPSDDSGVLPKAPDGGAGFDLGRNGTYLVFRQLEQHVERFWGWVRDAVGEGTDEVPNAIRLAAKEFGRWPSGEPLVLSPDRDPGGYSSENDFEYAVTDPDGTKCPLSAHARRGNPRDSLVRAGGAEESLLETKRHRLVRRARAYGRPLDPSLDPAKLMEKPADGESRGLQFLCFNSNIDRQFEFVQQTWFQNPVLNDQYANPDPILSERPDGEGMFVEQARPVRVRWTGMPPVVTVRGGAYFFMPGLKALEHLTTQAERISIEDNSRERLREAWEKARERMNPDDIKAIEAMLDQAHEEASAGPGGQKGSRHAPGEMSLALSAIRTELEDPGADLDVPYILPDGTIMGVAKYEQLDPRWLEAVVDWLHHQPDTFVPFRKGATPQEIPSDLVVGLLGDWGSGKFEYGQAEAVGDALRARHPDISVHLGDVYYSGTKEREREHLIDALPEGRLGSFALNSNHEMFVGGKGYFHALLDEAPAFERQAGKSYFALENDDWVIVGLDSAYNASYIGMFMTGVLCEEQIDFLAEQAKTGRNMVILSHHPGLDQCHGSPIEPFFSQVTAHLDPKRTNLWYWGHNHAGYVHQYHRAGSVDCRCVGHGALPWGPASGIAANPTIEWLEDGTAEPWPRLLNGFAVLRFRGAELSEEILDSRGRVRWSRQHKG